MKQCDARNGMFYREQTLANLRFLFDGSVEIITSAGDDGCVIAFACQIAGCDGERVKIMQTYAGDVLKALKGLHDMSCTRLKDFSTDCGHGLHRSNDLARSEDSNVMVDMPIPEKEPETHEAGLRHKKIQEESTNVAIPKERGGNLTGTALEISQYDLTPSTSVSSHAHVRGFSILLDIYYPFKGPVGALRYIESPSRQNILRVVAQILSASDIADDPIWPMRSLSVRKGNIVYDVLGYPRDDIGSLLDDIHESEKLIKIECVY